MSINMKSTNISCLFFIPLGGIDFGNKRHNILIIHFKVWNKMFLPGRVQYQSKLSLFYLHLSLFPGQNSNVNNGLFSRVWKNCSWHHNLKKTDSEEMCFPMPRYARFDVKKHGKENWIP